MLSIVIFFSILCQVVDVIAQNEKVETISCPGGTFLSGLSLSMSNLQTWPETSAPSSVKSRIPFSVCITCKGVNTKVYQVCISQGDATLMVNQFFECTSNDFLQTFFKNESQTNAYFSCMSDKIHDALDKDKQAAVYESKFPAPKSGAKTGIAKQNWQDMRTDLDCTSNDETSPKQQFICGLHVQMSVKEEDVIPSEVNSTEIQTRKLRKLSLPYLTEICCQGGDSPGRPNAEFFTSSCNEGNASIRIALIVIGTFFAITLLILIACAAHIAGFNFCFSSQPKSSVRPTKYETRDNGYDHATRKNSASSGTGIPVTNSSTVPID